jgi:hypothetical protein
MNYQMAFNVFTEQITRQIYDEFEGSWKTIPREVFRHRADDMKIMYLNNDLEDQYISDLEEMLLDYGIGKALEEYDKACGCDTLTSIRPKEYLMKILFEVMMDKITPDYDEMVEYCEENYPYDSVESISSDDSLSSLESNA